MSSVRVAGAMLVALFWSAVARADAAQHFSLSWTRLSGASRCISLQGLAARIEKRLARPVFDAPEKADLGIEGYVEWTGKNWHVKVSLLDANGAVLGVRELTSSESSCRELDGPVTLAIALLVDPNAELSEQEQAAKPQEPAVAPESPVARSEPDAVTQPKEPHASDGWRSAAAAGAGVAVGALPNPAGGIVLRFALSPPRSIAFVADGAFWTESRTPSAEGESIAFSLAYGGVGVCPLAWERDAGAVRACLGMNAGLLSTRGLLNGTILVRRRFVAMAAARLEGVVNLGSHVFLSGSAGAMAPLVRDSFEYESQGNRDLVFRMAPIAGVFDVGIGFRSP